MNEAEHCPRCGGRLKAGGDVDLCARCLLAAALEPPAPHPPPDLPAPGQGIVHRDLKPSNILVMDLDGEAVPKIIDFGLSKATDKNTAEHTLFTEVGVLIGTPEYMSPEQAS